MTGKTFYLAVDAANFEFRFETHKSLDKICIGPTTILRHEGCCSKIGKNINQDHIKRHDTHCNGQMLSLISKFGLRRLSILILVLTVIPRQGMFG